MAATTESQVEQPRLQRGPYLGEVSALCFLHLPVSSLPFLLAGTGSQILVYDLQTAKCINSFQAFDGVRVHGIAVHRLASQPPHESISATVYNVSVVVYGETRVKLYSLTVSSFSPSLDCSHSQFGFQLDLLHSLPRFSHWVLDCCFLKDDASSSTVGSHCLAIGCSDNSLCFWDTSTCNVVARVSSAERCLLYSMRIWGDMIESLQVASGTIYNEIIVWKVDLQNSFPAPISHVVDQKYYNENGMEFRDQKYQVIPICKLTGHEGSIFRISWSSNGSRVVSASDDRSARIWDIKARTELDAGDVDNHLIGPVLFGHDARIWDCCIIDNLVITAGEDCTCRIWGADGIQLKLIKEHIGRGIWRCLYDPISSVLVTAGFDCAIKVHQLHASSFNSSESLNGVRGDLVDRNDVLTISLPNSSGNVGLSDSKSEYVRCLQFTREDSFYVATNNGFLYHTGLLDDGEVKWTLLVSVGDGAPIICMDCLMGSSSLSGCVEDWISVGDGKGNMTIVHVVGNISSPKVEITFSWSAETERQLLGTYWCKSLGCRYIFTTNPKGCLKLWRLCVPSASSSHGSCRTSDVCFITEFISCYGLRILCLDASLEEEVLVCGDIRGNISLFPISRDTFSSSCFSSNSQVLPLSYFRGAHGISSVCSVSIASSSLIEVDICSTGQDGCICYFKLQKARQSLEFVGMKIVKGISTLLSIFSNVECKDGPDRNQYAIGFASSNFVIWNLTSETEVVKVPCGGWRRPHSFYVGSFPEKMNCFGFVKNELIHIHRCWVHDGEWKIYPKNLHFQFHGREVHSLRFICGDSKWDSIEKHGTISNSGWIATGSEDGTVRLSRFDQELKNWSTSKLLGEHVNGSAVKSLCVVSKMYTILDDPNCIHNGVHSSQDNLEEPDNFSFLISVGAKRVLTVWKQKPALADNIGEVTNGEPTANLEHDYNGSSATFEWFSADMPAKHTNKAKQNGLEDGLRNIMSPSNPCSSDEVSNDWRYLAVTAFNVKIRDSRMIACFIVVACSDATITLRALLLPSRLWFDVAVFTCLSSPVLALQHLILPKRTTADGHVFLVISGSTDGSVGFWDLTSAVENFMLQASSLELKDYFDSQRKPRTGRGSQGGRRRKSTGYNLSKENAAHNDSSCQLPGKDDDSVSIITSEKCVTSQTSNLHRDRQSATCSSQLRDETQALNDSEEAIDSSSLGVTEIKPVHVLNNAHQSGVNCLYVSDTKDSIASMYYVMSGGDDQVLNCLTLCFTLEVASQKYYNSLDTQNLGIHSCRINDYTMKLLSLDKNVSAHSSAIKGVWTDGSWVFSTGLDQRIRCWSVDRHGKLLECAHTVISVPEPESLDACRTGRNRYLIAVAGRGMQMVDFFGSSSKPPLMED